MLRACAILGLALCIVLPHAWAPHAWAQEPEPWPRQQPWPGVVQQQQPEEEGEFRISPLLRLQTLGPAVSPAYPGLSTYTLELLGLLMYQLEQREVNLLLTIDMFEEYIVI